MKNLTLIVLCLIIICVLIFGICFQAYIAAALSQKLEKAFTEQEEIRQRQDEIWQRQERILRIFEGAERYEVTGYAPLDPRAVKGMCYSGDPNITASGSPPVAGETVAAGRSIPFGTIVWIEGVGLRRVNDRGDKKKIHDKAFDVVYETREEAFATGRTWRRALVL